MTFFLLLKKITLHLPQLGLKKSFQGNANVLYLQPVENFRRSRRLDKANNGHKANLSTTSQRSTKRKSRNKQVASSTSLTGKLLCSDFSASIDFPGLVDLEKMADQGTVFHEIPVEEIQKIAIQKCQIPPSEVTAELLLDASVESKEMGEGCIDTNSLEVTND